MDTLRALQVPTRWVTVVEDEGGMNYCCESCAADGNHPYAAELQRPEPSFVEQRSARGSTCAG